MDYSRKIQDDNSQGGASKVYLMSFKSYLQSEITVSNNILTVFPYNIIYDMNAVNITYDIEAKEDVYNEKVSFQVKKLSKNDNFDNFIKQDYRIIVKDNLGKIRLFGLQNGMIGGFKEEIGTSKSDFYGYSFSFENKEERSAPYLNNLELFNVMPIEGLLMQDGNDNLLQDGNNNILTN